MMIMEQKTLILFAMTTKELIIITIMEDNDRAEFFDLDDMDVDDNDRAEFSDLDDMDEDDNNNGELQLMIFPDMFGLRQYDLSLTTLPTLPAYIHISGNYNYKSTVFLINSDTSVFLICPAPPLPVSPLDKAENDDNNNNNQPIYRAITMPFVLTLPFNMANTNIVIHIYIRVSVRRVIVYATAQVGVTDCAAYLTMPAPQT
ncbi:hypothetical protein TanjilG_14145 [Lupinus angustifolius]|uniref:Uncharacterized protein n=1 Tax=Lupinus angustifolius TaxID=3871 RepID=A0A1J7I980_LUPAN|nr:hypothetical protein TanjilG_14145 [Lupinus angustifolius]